MKGQETRGEDSTREETTDHVRAREASPPTHRRGMSVVFSFALTPTPTLSQPHEPTVDFELSLKVGLITHGSPWPPGAPWVGVGTVGLAKACLGVPREGIARARLACTYAFRLEITFRTTILVGSVNQSALNRIVERFPVCGRLALNPMDIVRKHVRLLSKHAN